MEGVNPLEIRDYYQDQFRTDLTQFMPRADVRYFGHSWHVNCSGLEAIPVQRRPQFLACLYFTVLIDQAIHAHFRALHGRFDDLTHYPKFCHGLGQFQKNPREILDTPFEQKLVNGDALALIVPSAVELFVQEVVEFGETHMPDLSARDLFMALIDDPDVAIPLLVVHLRPELREFPGWIMFEALRAAVRSRWADD